MIVLAVLTDAFWVGLFVLLGNIFTGLIGIWTKKAIDLNRKTNNTNAETSAKKVEEVKKELGSSTNETNGKLDVIHGLVNSQLSTAVTNELNGAIRERAMMFEVIDLKKIAGQRPTREALQAIEALEVRIQELKVIVSDRSKQQVITDKQVAAQNHDK